MYLEAFYRVLPLLIETCGRLLLSSCCSLYNSNTLSMEGKEASSSIKKKKIWMATLLSKKTYFSDLVCLPIYRENSPPRSPNQGRPLSDLLVGLGDLRVPPKAPHTRPLRPRPPYWILQGPIREEIGRAHV